MRQETTNFALDVEKAAFATRSDTTGWRPCHFDTVPRTASDAGAGARALGSRSSQTPQEPDVTFFYWGLACWPGFWPACSIGEGHHGIGR